MSQGWINPIGYNQGPKDWVDKVAEIREFQGVIKRHSAYMTQFERITASEKLESMKKRHFPAIYAGAKEVMDGHIAGYRQARAKVTKAQEREINSWASARLTEQMDLYQRMVEGALNASSDRLFRPTQGAAERVRRIYQEAMQSEDRYRQRAACEIILGLGTRLEGMPREIHLGLLSLEREAGQKLAELRTTAELTAAEAEVKQAEKNLIEAHGLIKDVAISMGEEPDGFLGDMRPLSKLLKQVQSDPKTGEVRVYDADAPEVTGVFFKPEDGQTEGG